MTATASLGCVVLRLRCHGQLGVQEFAFNCESDPGALRYMQNPRLRSLLK